MGSIWPRRIIFMCCAKTISITVLRFYDFVRLSIVMSFQIMISNSVHKWHPYNQICVGVQSDPGKLIAMQPLRKCFFTCNIHVRPGFLDPDNMGKDTKINFLSHILRKLWGIEYLTYLAQTGILCFAYMREKLLKGAGVALFWSHSYDMSSKWCQIWYVK